MDPETRNTTPLICMGDTFHTNIKNQYSNTPHQLTKNQYSSTPP